LLTSREGTAARNELTSGEERKEVGIPGEFDGLISFGMLGARQVRELIGHWGKGILRVARELGVGTGTVQRVKLEMEGPFVGATA
jgi:hypothetical protein